MASDTLHHHPAAPPPMPAVVRILSRFDRPKLEGFIAVAIGLLDVLDGDPDLENATGAEDAFEDHEERFGYDGPGCDVADPGEDEHDREAVDEREPDHDAEIQTWSHPDDHPAELHIGKRPGCNDGPEAA